LTSSYTFTGATWDAGAVGHDLYARRDGDYKYIDLPANVRMTSYNKYGRSRQIYIRPSNPMKFSAWAY
jgi:hypothetical protein